MRYGDLFQFEPIESVIQLLDANRSDKSKKLVSSYVISDDMAERITNVIVPQLSFDGSVDHKGVLVGVAQRCRGKDSTKLRFIVE